LKPAKKQYQVFYLFDRIKLPFWIGFFKNFDLFVSVGDQVSVESLGCFVACGSLYFFW